MLGTYNRLNLHVSASPREVIRAASRKIKRSHRYAREHRADRHKFYRLMLDYHGEAGELFRAVAHGF